MKKRFIAILIVSVLIVSTFSMMTALVGASVSIKGNSEVIAGKSYTYEVTVSANCFNFISQVECGGVFSGGSVACDQGGSANGNISKTVSINVTVAADAQPGQTGTISVRGEGCSVDADGIPIDSFSISGSKSASVVVQAASTPKPEKTPKPSSNKTETSKTESKPTPTPEPSAWQLASDDVDSMEQGGTLTVDLTGEDDDHEIPVEIYNALREKKGKLTLNFGTYSCTLDGAALGELDEEEDELDLGLSFEADEEYSAAVGGNDVYQLHFSHKGEFPGKISFTFKADKNSPGDTVYLYYYYGTSKVIAGIQSAVVDENGFVTFDIYHCSSYFVASALVEGAAGIVTQAEPEPTPTPEPTAEPTPEPTPTPEPEPNPITVEPQTNGFSPAVLISVGLGAALLAVLFTMIIFRVGLFRKKRTRHSEF